MDAEPEIARLYGLPLAEFTPARNALAASLKGVGQSEDAARVKKLKKPSLPAWAVNRLVREDRPAIERLLELVDGLKEAGSASEIHALGAERRELVARLARRAGEILEESGHAASATALQRVTQTLQAGAGDDQRRQLLEGTLSDDLDPTGFDALGAFGPSDAFTLSPPPRSDRAEEVEELRRVAAEAEEEAARLTEEAERAEAAAMSASEAASEARRRAREAREAAQKAARAAR